MLELESVSKKYSSFPTDPSLSDHHRHKQRLLAPWHRLRHDDKIVLSHWEFTRLPEIIWINELIHFLGKNDSLSALEIAILSAREARTSEEVTCPPLASYWQLHAAAATKALYREQLKNAGLLDRVKEALIPLQSHYPSYPFAFMSTSEWPAPVEEALQSFKQRLPNVSDRFTAQAVRLHSHIMMAELRTGTLHVPENFEGPNFDLIYSEGVDVDTEEFANAAGMIRACVGNLFAYFHENSELVVGKYFWNRGVELEPCTTR